MSIICNVGWPSMRLSLLGIRKRLVPLAWLLTFVMLAPVSPHVVRGLVLCIGKSHVDIEVAGPAHHDGRSDSTGPAHGSLSSAEHSLFAFRDAKVSEEEGPCRDVPLRLTRGAADPCHQAVQNKAADADMSLLDPLATTALGIEPRIDASHPLPRPATPTPTSPRPSSTVVLLI